MTTILHIEDDPSLAEMVSDAFAAFGFRGASVIATTVGDARRILTDVERYPVVDLIISDMELPDGTGLDVVRDVRSHPLHAHVPILILSGQTDPALVDRAYALGANSYISKGTRGRSVADTVRALHDHWLKDARLPPPKRAARTHDVVARAATIHARKARLYMEIAEQLGLGSVRGGFWVDLALREGNFASLLSFLLGQLDDRELTADVITEALAIQTRELRFLDALERHPVRGEQDADRYMREVVANACSDAPTIMRATGQLFPIVPVAVTALLDVAATVFEDMASWLEDHASDPQLREHIARLRAGAAELRATPSPD